MAALPQQSTESHNGRNGWAFGCGSGDSSGDSNGNCNKEGNGKGNGDSEGKGNGNDNSEDEGEGGCEGNDDGVGNDCGKTKIISGDAPCILPPHLHGDQNRQLFSCIFVVVDFMFAYNHC